MSTTWSKVLLPFFWLLIDFDTTKYLLRQIISFIIFADHFLSLRGGPRLILIPGPGLPLNGPDCIVLVVAFMLWLVKSIATRFTYCITGNSECLFCFFRLINLYESQTSASELKLIHHNITDIAGRRLELQNTDVTVTDLW